MDRFLQKLLLFSAFLLFFSGGSGFVLACSAPAENHSAARCSFIEEANPCSSPCLSLVPSLRLLSLSLTKQGEDFANGNPDRPLQYHSRFLLSGYSTAFSISLGKLGGKRFLYLLFHQLRL